MSSGAQHADQIHGRQQQAGDDANQQIAANHGIGQASGERARPADQHRRPARRTNGSMARYTRYITPPTNRPTPRYVNSRLISWSRFDRCGRSAQNAAYVKNNTAPSLYALRRSARPDLMFCLASTTADDDQNEDQ
jgi:hypothetical protein